MKAKSLLLILTFAFFTLNFAITGFAQSPQLINYQAVARNAGGQLIMNQNISVRISILSGSATGTTEYSETHTVTTNQFGIFNIQIGAGTVVSGIFAQISWSSADHFVKVEADETGGTNYLLLGTSQLISVPYSLYAEKSGDGFSGDYNDLSNQPTLFSGTWGDLTGKPTFATVATSGSFDDLLNKPTLFDGTWISLTGKPTSLAGYGITDAMNTSHAANGITSTNISNWNSAYSWGDHTTAGYLTSFTEQDTMLWKKNGNDLFYKNGNVGIGTTTPDKPFHISFVGNYSGIGAVTASVNTAFKIENIDLTEGNSSNLLFKSSAGGSASIGAVFSNGNSFGSMAISTKGSSGLSERMRIDTSGNVGIGTSIPGNILHIDGGIGNTYISLTNNWSGHTVSDGFVVGLANDGNSAVVWTYDSVPLRFGTAYNERMRITNNGNVGIGTINPVSPLDVRKSASSEFSASFWNTAADGFGLYSRGGGVNAANTIFYFENYSGSASKTMMMNGDGYVGIGTTNPGYKLDVAGTMNAQEIRVNGVVLNPGTGSNWSVSGSDVYRLSGNVGIGTVTPTSNLQITGNGAYIKLEDTRTGNGAKTYSVGTSRVAYGDFAIIDESISATTARLYIQSGGNVGIGTINPTAKLDVVDNSGGNLSEIKLRQTGGINNPILHFSAEETGNRGVIYTETNCQLDLGSYNMVDMTLKNGNVGIGTTNPSAKLHTYSTGNAYNIFESSSASGALNYLSFAYNGVSKGYVGFGSNDDIFRVTSLFNNDMMFMTNNLERIRILANGNVGIGTANPSAKLEVNNSHIILMSTIDNFALFVDGIDGDGYFGIKNINNQGLMRDNQSNLGDLIIRAENKTIRFTADAGNTAHMSITNSGKIGIGTTTPDPNYKLHIKGSPASVMLEENNPNIRFMKDSTTFWDIGHWSSENNNFKIVYGIGNSKGIHIDTTGNVGIGTTNPLSKLSINGGLHVGGDGDPGDNNLLVDGIISELGTRNQFFSGYSFNSGSPMHTAWNMTFGMAYNLNNITGISYLNLPVKTGQIINEVRIALNVLGTGTVSVTLDLIEQAWNSTAITVIGTATGTGYGDISISGLPYEVADGKTIYVRINITDATNTAFGLHSLRVQTQAK